MMINSLHLLDFGALGGGLGHRGISGTFISKNGRPASTGARFSKSATAICTCFTCPGGFLRDLYFQKWAFRLDGSTIFETCTSKNGKRVTEGAYAFAWDEERAGERVREDETRSQITK